MLYGRSGEHEKAFELLVRRLEDYTAAEQYCLRHAEGGSAETRHAIFAALLRVYLTPGDGHPEGRVAPALSLLNAHGHEFDALEVLSVLPEQLSLRLVEPFLRTALRRNMHSSRMTAITKSLSKVDHLAATIAHRQEHCGRVVIDEQRVCEVCHRHFLNASAFVRLPSGLVAHLPCRAKAEQQERELAAAAAHDAGR